MQHGPCGKLVDQLIKQEYPTITFGSNLDFIVGQQLVDGGQNKFSSASHKTGLSASYATTNNIIDIGGDSSQTNAAAATVVNLCLLSPFFFIIFCIALSLGGCRRCQ